MNNNSLIEANIKLQDENRRLKLDLLTLVNYIVYKRGTREEVKEVLNHYKNKQLPREAFHHELRSDVK